MNNRTPIKFDVCSDLHIEFDLDYDDINYKFFENLFKDFKSPNLIIAGDLFAIRIECQDDEHMFNEVIGSLNDYVKDHFENALFVLGNHDYWYYDSFLNVNEVPQWWTERMPAFNVLDINTNPKTRIGDIDIFGSTGWTQLDELGQCQARMFMNDYRNCANGTLTPSWTSRQAAKTHRMLEKFAKSTTNGLVITHHAPSFKCAFQNKSFPAAYCNSWDGLMISEQSGIQNWIHGHLHQHYQRKIGHCNVFSNARGYREYEAIASYFKPLTIKI